MMHLTWLGNQSALSIAFLLATLAGVGIGAWLNRQGGTK